MSKYPGRDRFLADIGVTRSVNQSLLMGFRQLHFDAPNDEHRTVQFAQDLPVDLSRIVLN